MRLSTLLFLATVGVSAAMAIAAAAKEDRSGTYLFKPLTTLIILLGAAFLVQPGAQPYRGLVVLGLAFSLAGDVLLMLPRDRLTAGLAAFLLAHAAYILAFTTGSPVELRQLPWALPFLAAVAIVLAATWRGLGAHRAVASLYAVVTAAAAWRAAARLSVPAIPHAGAFHALAGACLLLLSDAIIAVRRFRHPSRLAHAMELGAYWTAQVMIALSVRG